MRPSPLLFVCCLVLVPLLSSCHWWSEDDNLFEYVTDANSPGHCIWYDNCKALSNNRHSPCVYNGSAIEVPDDNTMDLLKTWCPMYRNETKETTRTCCNAAQLTDLGNQFAMMEQMLSRCPSCYNNMLKLFCALTCDPHQSQFVMVENTSPPDPTMAVPFIAIVK